MNQETSRREDKKMHGEREDSWKRLTVEDEDICLIAPSLTCVPWRSPPVSRSCSQTSSNPSASPLLLKRMCVIVSLHDDVDRMNISSLERATTTGSASWSIAFVCD